MILLIGQLDSCTTLQGSGLLKDSDIIKGIKINRHGRRNLFKKIMLVKKSDKKQVDQMDLDKVVRPT